MARLPIDVVLTRSFRLKEFACHEGTPVPNHYRDNVVILAEQLQALRDDLGVPIQIVSGYRTPDYNARVGGAANSQHVQAKAADIKCALTPEHVHAAIERLIRAGKMRDGGVGLYAGWVHYDIGPVRRWRG